MDLTTAVVTSVRVATGDWAGEVGLSKAHALLYWKQNIHCYETIRWVGMARFPGVVEAEAEERAGFLADVSRPWEDNLLPTLDVVAAAADEEDDRGTD